EVDVVHCGSFLPSLRERGNRLNWHREKLDEGRRVVGQLCQIVSNGAFLATNNHEEDCKFCAYQKICGDVRQVSAASARKLDNPANVLLQPFRELRSHAQA